jgi:hypothetical protein
MLHRSQAFTNGQEAPIVITSLLLLAILVLVVVVCRSSGTAIIYRMRCNIMLVCYPAFSLGPRPSTRDEDNNSKFYVIFVQNV